MSSNDSQSTHDGLLSDASLMTLHAPQQPFLSTTATGELFTDDHLALQISDIKEALITGDDLLLLVGPEGAGKSTLLRQFNTTCGARIQCFNVTGNERFSSHNLFAGMLEAFKITPTDDLQLILDELIPCLQAMAQRNRQCVVMLDDAHRVPRPELTKLLGSMLYLNGHNEPLLRIALAVTDEFEASIPDILAEGADLPYGTLHVAPMDIPRARAYLDFRNRLAGADETLPFDEQQWATLNQQAAGRPAGLHRVAADMLNSRFGQLELNDLPPEFRAPAPTSFLHTTAGKLVLGIMAVALILIGALMFIPSTEDTSERYAVVEERPLDLTGNDAAKIRLLDEKTSATADTTTSTTRTPPTPSDSATTESTASSGNEDSSSAALDSLDDRVASGQSDTTAAAAADEVRSATPPSTPAPSPAESPAETNSADSTDNSTDADNEPASSTSGEPSDTAVTTPSPATITDADDALTAIEPFEPVEEDEPDRGPGSLESANWILVQNPGQYTVQMSASTDRRSVEQFLERNPLDPPSSIFSFERNDRTWFALVNGLYPTIAAAQAAIERLPASARSDQPWIRAISRVQNAVKQ